MDIKEVSATKPIPKTPWNKRDRVIARCMQEWMGWSLEDIDTYCKQWSSGRLGAADVTQEHVKAFNKFLRNRIKEVIGEDGLDDFINKTLKEEGLE